MPQKILLFCGIIASLLYLGMDLISGKLIKGYNFISQSMSELGAAGSPTRPLIIALTVVACAFMIAFAVGVWIMTGPAVLPRIVAVLIFGNAVTGLISTLFFPNQFGVRPEFGTPGVMLMFVSVLCFVLAMIVGAFAFGGWMRVLSIAIPVAYILLAVLRVATAAGSPVSIGVQERTMSYTYLLWIIGLAIYLW